MKGPPRMLNEPEKKSVWSTVCSVLLALLALLLFVQLWFSSNYTAVCVSGASMNDTLRSGDWLYTRKTAFERFDIVTIDVRGMERPDGSPVFTSAEGDGQVDMIIKRVIGLEGDALKCEDGVLYIRYAGTEEFVRFPDEPWAKGNNNSFPVREVGEGEIFVLGDNRARSQDSSRADVGCLKADKVLGVVTEWSIAHKDVITQWETFRNNLRNGIYELFFGKVDQL